MKKPLILASLIALATPVLAQDALKATRVKPDQLMYKDMPVIPKGGQFAIMVGDPTKHDLVVQSVKFPANYRVPPHTHPYGEVVTVISGSVGFGLGETFDMSKGEMVPAGSVNVVPAKQPHFLWTGSEGATVHVQFVGPGGIDYINPADDPRKKTN